MDFHKDHAVTFLNPKFIVFLMKKSHTSASAHVASFDAMQKCDDFWHPGAKRFPTIYCINGFTSKFFIP